MKVSRLFPILLLMVILTSCEKEFIPPEQEAAKKMTVNCLFDNNGVFHVYLTESFTSISSHKIVPLPDADVELFEDDIYKEKMNYIPSDSLNTFGSYQSTFIPFFGMKYRIVINHPVYGVVTAEDVMPSVTAINSATMITTGNANQNIDAIAEINFDDDITADNFYRLNTWIWLSQKVYDPISGDTVDQGTFQGVRVIPEESLADSVREYGWALLFSDKNFNGQNKTLNLHFKGLRLNRYEQIRLHIDLNNVSPSHFEYFRTLELYRHNGNDLSEQPEVYTNIENGYGIFAGSAVSSSVIVIK